MQTRLKCGFIRSVHGTYSHRSISQNSGIPCGLDGIGEVPSSPDSIAIRAHYGSVTKDPSTCQDRYQRSRVTDGPQGQGCNT